MFRRILLIFFLLSLVGLVAAAIGLTWGYFYITRDMPRLTNVEDFRPPSVSQVFASDGKLVAEFYQERRYPVKIEEVPKIVTQAFLAAEDASFYEHPGIDLWSILRAFVKNLMGGGAKQGGSTITQQVVKNLILSPEKSLERKIKEAILSYRLEKRLSKDDIFEIYLNQIFFGNSAYGIKAASKLYFHKELSELTLAEAALLAGLPPAPSRYSPILNPEAARRRQRYVLRQMVKAGLITEEISSEALREKLKVYPASSQNFFEAPYYVAEVRRVLQERWKELNIDVDGLKIYTALDREADALASKALRQGLRDVDKRRGWRGPLESRPDYEVEQFQQKYSGPRGSSPVLFEPYPALVRTSASQGKIKVLVGTEEYTLNLREATWATRKREHDDGVHSISLEHSLRPGDVIEVSFREKEQPKEPAKGAPAVAELEIVLDQTPDIEGALTLLDPFSGEVRAVIGGYSYGRSVFNRATQSLRQPGSAFKPIVYLAAIDAFQYTPATLVDDRPRTFRIGDQYWTPSNFDEKFLGDITLRVALEKSRNLVTADIISRIGIDSTIQYAKKVGIDSKMGRNLSLALGSSEVTLLELTRAYGVFAAKGVLTNSIFVTKVLDREGNTIYDFETERISNARQVISEQSAFLMANLMKGVVESGTAVRVKEIKRPVAGKTGTSNDEMDTWFIGYTPQWVCGVWAGFDLKKRIGPKETGGRVSAPIWLNFMRDFLNRQDEKAYTRLEEESRAEAERLGIEFVPPEPLEPLDFQVPEGVEPFLIYKESGIQASEFGPGVIQEYFLKGTAPNKSEESVETPQSYLDSPDL